MKRQNCINCIFSSWYHNFQRVTFKSKIIQLPVEFISYLTSDGIVLPDDDHVKYANDVEGYSDDDDDEWNDNVPATEGTSLSSFPDLKKEVEDAIRDLGQSKFLFILHIQSFFCIFFP